MQVLSRWSLKKRQEMAETQDKIAETAETEKDKIADTAETEKEEIADTAMESSPRLQDNTAKTRLTESRFTERFTANPVYREPKDCNMYRDCTSSPRAKRL